MLAFYICKWEVVNQLFSNDIYFLRHNAAVSKLQALSAKICKIELDELHTREGTTFYQKASYKFLIHFFKTR